MPIDEQQKLRIEAILIRHVNNAFFTVTEKPFLENFFIEEEVLLCAGHSKDKCKG
jgi:hypothetical protein